MLVLSAVAPSTGTTPTCANRIRELDIVVESPHKHKVLCHEGPFVVVRDALDAIGRHSRTMFASDRPTLSPPGLGKVHPSGRLAAVH